jgi:hypothetical protein
MLNAVLKIIGGKQDGKLIPLPTKKFLIGREQDCHLRPSSDSVSRHRCVINIDDFGIRVRDLGSSNGTFLNGTRLVGTQAAKSGDNLKVGTLEFEIQFQENEAALSDSGSNTTFSLNEFDLDPAAADETVMLGGDTAVMNAAAAAESPTETVEAPVPVEATAAVDAGAPTIQPAPEAAPIEQPTAQLTAPVVAEPAAVPQVDPAIAAQQQIQPGMQYPGQQMPGQPMPGQPMPGQPMPGQPMPGQMMPPGYPQPMQQPGYPYPQQQQPFNPYMPQQQPGYPPMQQPQYGAQYPQQPQPFPQQPMQGYPAQQPVAPASAPAPEYDEEDEEEYDDVDEPAVVLPPPEETGLKEEKKSDDDGGDDKPSAPQSNPAADILKKMSERR